MYSLGVIKKRMCIHSIIELGRHDSQKYYIVEHDNGVIQYKCSQVKTDVAASNWNLTIPKLTTEKVDYRMLHKSPIPKSSKATYFLPKGKTNCEKWLLYCPGGALLFHSYLILPRLQEIFPDFGIVLVDYGVVPEKSFPSPLVDVLDTYHYMLNVMKVDSKFISFLSDSAGGHICLGALLKIKEYILSPPSCCVFLSPWTDLTCSGNSFKEKMHIDYLDVDIKLLLEVYSNTEYDLELLKTKEYSPVFGDLSGIPPILINSGACEALLDDNKLLYKRLKEAGNADVHHTVYDNMPHDFQMFYFQESNDSLKEIQTFINKHT